jgi:putative membrane protein
MKIKEFFKNTGLGAAIGVAMIIPGVSGGTIAVLFKVYDRLINAISDLRRDFKNSFMFLLPIVIGALLGIAALYFPLKYAIQYAPIPTILLFAGLMLGSCPKLFKDTLKKGFKPIDAVSLILPLAFVIGICFIPQLGHADLSATMPIWGYFVLILIGAIASCALVVPGVSGSLLLLVLGYYTPILDTVSALFNDFGHSVLVLTLFALGLIVGFFSIAKLMKFLLKKFPRGTGWAIMGFVIGSIPALCLTEEFTSAPIDGIQIAAGAILCLAGVIASYAVTAYAEARNRKDRI